MSVFFRTRLLPFIVLALIAGLLSSCGFKRKKYENPITKDTQQPDKVLFDKAILDIERGKYEVGRLTLQTLMNTYDTSEFLAKSKLAYADSWFREGGTAGLANAEAEYKDFILFYPQLEESAEAQEKVCMIHYRQMEKPDRDNVHAFRAEEECRNLLQQFPNSKFAPRAQQLLRNIQEVIAEGEFRRGSFYHGKASHPAAANRLQALTDHYPLFSAADQANMFLGDSYEKMGPRLRNKAGAAYARVVREYPLSPLVEDAKKRLAAMEMPIPEVDPVAYNRMKYELENRDKASIAGNAFGVLMRGPSVRTAAKSGTPAMEPMRPTLPVTVPAAAESFGFTGDVAVQQVGPNSALDSKPDARAGGAPAAPAAEGATTTPEGGAAAPGAAATAPGDQTIGQAAGADNTANDAKGKKNQKKVKQPKQLKRKK
ncbi:MAG: outer membrane protein assembly factor BamD [Bryobacteraceae bacterium]|nr:outer membrane protein assembly factor BamD [Bryobacteraceae bacterium]